MSKKLDEGLRQLRAAEKRVIAQLKAEGMSNPAALVKRRVANEAVPRSSVTAARRAELLEMDRKMGLVRSTPTCTRNGAQMIFSAAGVVDDERARTEH